MLEEVCKGVGHQVFDAFLISVGAVLTFSLHDCLYNALLMVQGLERMVMELVCLAIVLVFFGLSFGMVRLLERL